MGTKNNPSPFDCYANADGDEPLFVLLARDKHAPTLVWLWTLLREIEGEDANKVAQARDCVDDMLQWQVGHGRKTIGLGHAALAAVMGLVRAANASVKNAPNAATRDSELQRVLSLTLFDLPEEAQPPAGAESPTTRLPITRAKWNRLVELAAETFGDGEDQGPEWARIVAEVAAS